MGLNEGCGGHLAIFIIFDINIFTWLYKFRKSYLSKLFVWSVQIDRFIGSCKVTPSMGDGRWLKSVCSIISLVKKREHFEAFNFFLPVISLSTRTWQQLPFLHKKGANFGETTANAVHSCGVVDIACSCLPSTHATTYEEQVKHIIFLKMKVLGQGYRPGRWVPW